MARALVLLVVGVVLGALLARAAHVAQYLDPPDDWPVVSGIGRDIPAGAWARADALWSLFHGFIDPRPDGRFAGAELLTRFEAAALARRLFRA